MKKIKEIKISRRTNLVLFIILPIILYCIGTYMLVTANIGLFGLIFYMPTFTLSITSNFFTTGHKSEFGKKIIDWIDFTFTSIKMFWMYGVVGGLTIYLYYLWIDSSPTGYFRDGNPMFLLLAFTIPIVFALGQRSRRCYV